MLTFWLAAGLMLLLALAFALFPLLRRHSRPEISRRESNIAVLRTQREEIERDVAAGTLPATARDEALEELVTRAGEDLAASEEPASTAGPRPWKAIAALVVLLPAGAIGLYYAIGNPAAIGAAGQAVAPGHGTASPASDKQIEAMVVALGEKVKARPDDVQGWALYARSLNALGRWQEASDAYAHLAKLQPDDPSVLADWADALAMTQGKNLSGKPLELALRALKIDPAYPKALALAGTASLNQGDYPAALKYWQVLAATLPPEGPEAQQVASVIAEVRERAAAAGKPLAAGPAAKLPPALPKAPASVAKAPAEAARAVPSAPAAAGASVSGTVTLAPALAAKVAAGDILFVYARPANGPRMPLAVLRVPAKELPKRFTLDDSMAMSPAATISSAPEVIIEARVSKSGGAAPQAGDLSGTSAPVKPGAKNLAIVIDKVVP
jgi:cytochrome c-type biogenesis protein CcmH